eukprot:Awhi_evm1s12831
MGNGFVPSLPLIGPSGATSSTPTTVNGDTPSLSFSPVEDGAAMEIDLPESNENDSANANTNNNANNDSNNNVNTNDDSNNNNNSNNNNDN